MLKVDFAAFVNAHPEIKHYYLAYSGGLDSQVLLYLLYTYFKTNPEVRFTALHVNHKLSQNADAWQQHCLAQAGSYQIPIHIECIDVSPRADESIEQAARRQRYAVLQGYIDESACLITAHHQDDQAETFLLQSLRGAGPKGLAGMPTVGKFSTGWHWRPLLQESRSQLRAFANAHQLNWIEDESNADSKFARNFVRNEAFPLLKQKWPSLSVTLSRAAQHCQTMQDLCDELAAIDLERCRGDKTNQLKLEPFAFLSRQRQENLLRFWLRECGFDMPSAVKLKHIFQDVINSRPDATPCVCYGQYAIRRYANQLYAMTQWTALPTNWAAPWRALAEPFQLPDNLGQVVASYQATGLRLPSTTDLEVRFRRGGERIKLAGRGVTHTLKHCFQAWRVPPWQRERIPLLYYQDELVAVVGYGISEKFYSTNGGWRFDLRAE